MDPITKLTALLAQDDSSRQPSAAPSRVLHCRFTDRYLPEVDRLRGVFDRSEDQPATYAESADHDGRSIFSNIWDGNILISTDRLTPVHDDERSVIETWSAGAFTIPERKFGIPQVAAEGSRAVVDNAYGNLGIYTHQSATLCLLAHYLGMRVLYAPMEPDCPGLAPLGRMGFERLGGALTMHGLPGKRRPAVVYRIDLDENLGRCRDARIDALSRMSRHGFCIRN